MKKMGLAAAAALALAAGANAQVVNIGNISLAGFGANVTGNFTLPGGGWNGWRLTADALQAGGFAWQADARLIIRDSANNVVFDVGGFGSAAGPVAWSATSGPSFPANSSDPQPIDTGASFGATAGGTWSYEIVNSFTANAPTDVINWNNVVLQIVPSPASMALLGMGGLVALRRRR